MNSIEGLSRPPAHLVPPAAADARPRNAVPCRPGNPHGRNERRGRDIAGSRLDGDESGVVTWIRDFINTYRTRTGRWAVLYTTTSWWATCTGNYSGFALNNPLWIARWSTSVGTLPTGWSFWTFWQHSSTGSVSGISGNVDRNYFNGARDRLLALADNTA